jgi:hypothetical protein
MHHSKNQENYNRNEKTIDFNPQYYQKRVRERERERKEGKGGRGAGGEMAQTMCTHMNK